MPFHLDKKVLYYYTQGLHISFQYFVAKVLIWKLFMLLVESPFAGWFFPFKRFIEKVLIWSVFKLLVFLFAGCHFLEVPSFSGFSGQFERRIQGLKMRPIRFNTCNFCCIYLLNKLNNKNIECRHTSIKRCCTQGLQISFQYFVAKVLIWKLFMLLVESPFAGWFFSFQKVLIWSVFKLLVFLFAGCHFLEIPSFSGQFERKTQNLEWDPLDLTLATFAVFTC